MTNEKIIKALGLEEDDLKTIIDCLDLYVGVGQNNALKAANDNNFYEFEWYKRDLEKVRKLRDKLKIESWPDLRESLEVEGRKINE